MTPAQFLSHIKRNQIAPAYLFLGAEAYQGRRCREALLDAMLGAGERENGLAQYDLNDTSLAYVLDDARALSLFAPQRVILVSSAEAALPRQRSDEEDAGEASDTGAAELAAYMRSPSPGVVLSFEATRFDFEGEDKKKLERVQKFYSAVPETVELRRFSMDEARTEARTLARDRGVTIDAATLDVMVEALGGDVARIAVELEKLSLFSGAGRPITIDDISALVPDARSTTIFALVNALGRRDRSRGL
ncbi:MAG: polymerase delta subunit, partial [Bryobacterales bacterium]|nr:polymerase delta subunit [Bryobacterales bacterium]